MNKLIIILFSILLTTNAYSKEITLIIPDDIYPRVIESFTKAYIYNYDAKIESSDKFFQRMMLQHVKDVLVSYELQKATIDAKNIKIEELRDINIGSTK